MNQQAEIEKMNAGLQPLLPDGAVVTVEISKSKYGTSGGFLQPAPGGEYDHDALFERLREDDVSMLTRGLSRIFSLSVKEKGLQRAVGFFRFQKGGPPSLSIPTDAELVTAARQLLQADLTRFGANETGAQLDLQFLEGEGGVEVETVVLKQDDGRWSESFTSVPDEVFICLRETNGNDIERMVVFLEGDTFWIASNPPKPELGFKDLSEVTLVQDNALQARLDAIETARSMRQAFYSSLGELQKVEYEPYIPSALRGGNEWPAKKPRFQLIYTPVSTVVISSGLSDVFRDTRPDPKMEYNGYAIEFYLEFLGRIPWPVLENHQCLEWLNTITQVAIGHGELKSLLERNPTVSVELTAKGLPTTHSKKGDMAMAILGFHSPNLPELMQLNIEKVRLASVTMLTKKEAAAISKSSQEDKQAAAREKIAEAHVKDGTHCYNPFDPTQQKSDGGMVEVPLLPIG